MKHLFFLCILFVCALSNAQNQRPAGKLQISDEHRYLKQENGKPFFYLGDTGWLLPERLTRDEAAYYLDCCRKAGFNVVQVQTVNGVPAYNAYGASSHPCGYDFEQAAREGVYGYWEHMDYIVQTAERNGIYIGMVCIWGGLVKAGLMDEAQAVKYGTFLANRYKDAPNIIWIIGGDIQGDVKPEIWTTLARTIKSIDPDHLMTFHPRGRTMSTTYFNDAEWLDFNMFQSGHRRYGQRNGEKNYPIEENTEEDNWRYVERSLATSPMKPVLDGEPSYEKIPQGLHDPNEPRWQACDCRRYAYWSVFAGACGHTYGHNSIMQFYRPGIPAAYGARTAWYDALNDDGFNQMKYLKNLMLAFPYFERVSDQSIIAGENGEKYDRLIATRGKSYLLVYDYTARPMTIRTDKISGDKKRAWWYDPIDGSLSYIGTVENGVATFKPKKKKGAASDCVLIVVDAEKEYINPAWTSIPDAL